MSAFLTDFFVIAWQTTVQTNYGFSELTSIVQVLGNCFVTDSLGQLFGVVGNVQHIEYGMLDPRMAPPTCSASALLLSAPL